MAIPPGVVGSVLGLVGLVSVYSDRVDKVLCGYSARRLA